MTAPPPRKKKRGQTSLEDKSEVVDRYQFFVQTVLNYPKKELGMFDYDDACSRSETSIRAFLEEENLGWSPDKQLDMANVFKWIKAARRGDFLEWNGINDLSKPNAKSQQILRHINDMLIRNFAELCFYLKVVKSPSSPDLYGTIARSFIPAGMFLGFFHGEIKTFDENGPPNGPNMFTIVENSYSIYIDCSHDFLACYARYFNCSTKSEAHNVSVVRLKNARDYNRCVCFIANTDIDVGHELIIGSEQNYPRNGGQKRYKTEPCILDYDSVVVKAQLFMDMKDAIVYHIDEQIDIV
jgi:hypothetical protein